MAFTGNEDQQISLSEASELTKNYRDNSSPNEILGHYISKNALENILDQENCVGVRVYYALKADQTKQLVFVGVDETGNDLYNGYIADKTIPCPEICSVANPLNSD